MDGDNPCDARDPKCTCHPDDKPPLPCPRKYALTDCRNEATARKMATAMAVAENLHVENRMPEARRLLAAIQAMST